MVANINTVNHHNFPPDPWAARAREIAHSSNPDRPIDSRDRMVLVNNGCEAILAGRIAVHSEHSEVDLATTQE